MRIEGIKGRFERREGDFFWNFEKRERVGLGEVDDGKWRGEIKLDF